jgi:hypothetical protein
VQDRLASELTIDEPAGDRPDLAPWGFDCDLRPQLFCCDQIGEPFAAKLPGALTRTRRVGAKGG